ncbi:MAG: hypothetical protein KIS77_17120 [Saprospiraceae bacterium]|nr:hypothetical protein [Saprospiraceae bacterium]
MALSDNHKRAVWATLTVIEKRVDEIYMMLHGMPESSTYRFEDDLGKEESARILTLINQIKQAINNICTRYELNKDLVPFSRAIGTARSSIWENLLDTDTRRLQTYGAFSNEEDAAELQQSLQCLLSLTEQLSPKS